MIPLKHAESLDERDSVCFLLEKGKNNKEKRPYMLTTYQNKLKTPEEAAKVIQSGDWVDFGFGSGFAELMDQALANRRDELTDVKIRGGLVYQPLSIPWTVTRK